MRNSEEYLNIAMSLIDDIACTNKHVSLIVHKNKIVSIGTNSNKTHPKCKELGYPLLGIHSELASVMKAAKNIELKKCTLINIRLSALSTKFNQPILRNSRPCKYCDSWCRSLFRDIWFTTDNGFVNLKEME